MAVKDREREHLTYLVTSQGWRTAFTVLGLLLIIMIILLSQFLVRDPAKKGQLADNAREASVSKMDSSERGLSFQETVHTRQFWTVSAVYCLILACIFTIILHIVQHAIELGITATSAASVLATIGGVSIAGRFLMGSAGDRIGNRRALFICLLSFFMGLMWLQLAKTLWMFYAFAALYGFAHGGFYALGSPLVAGLFETRSHGLIFGIVIFSITIGGLRIPSWPDTFSM